MSDVCLKCGGEPYEVFTLVSFSGPLRDMPVFICCVPDPSPAQLRRRSEDDWLAWQRELATEAL